jgi:phosphomannomutase
VLRQETLDGMKLYLDDPEALPAETWVLLRASGTEPLLRIYAESGSPESVQRLLDAGRTFAMGDTK